MNRRRFLVSTATLTTAALGGPLLGTAAAASDDDLAFANFGVSAELLLRDFYARAVAAKSLGGAQSKALRLGAVAATQHAKALGDLLVGAGQTAPEAEDFEFTWPEGTFSSAGKIVATGLAVLRPLLGAYQAAAASVTDPAYRVLYASLVASLAQQIAVLSVLSGRGGIEQFPVAVDLEAASAALEGYLG